MYHLRTNERTYLLQEYPSNCPFCHTSFTPIVITGYHRGYDLLEVFMHCPDKKCLASFIAYYKIHQPDVNSPGCTLLRTMIGNISGKKFNEIITKNYPSFVAIYNEAFVGEQYGLIEICGVGYRKALEFLIKDYCSSLFPDMKDEIAKKLLGAVIKDYVTDPRVKKVAERAVWLGNDETHYIKKWWGKNLQDLKALIDLTIHWIEAEELTKIFEEEMPSKK